MYIAVYNKILETIIHIDDLHRYYNDSTSFTIIIINPSNEINHCDMYSFGYEVDSYYPNDLIQGDSYDIYSIKTIKKFNLKITSDYINNLCKHGKINILEYLLQNNKIIDYDTHALRYASENGHVNVLEWWKNSGLELKYDEYALSNASKYGYTNVLQWWKNSGLPLKYNECALRDASISGYTNVLQWWKNSGLPLKYNKSALDSASYRGYIDVLKWWKNSGLPLKYDNRVVNHYSSKDWWKNSGLPISINDKDEVCVIMVNDKPVFL
jgi:hypothetical protein